MIYHTHGKVKNISKTNLVILITEIIILYTSQTYKIKYEQNCFVWFGTYFYVLKCLGKRES